MSRIWWDDALRDADQARVDVRDRGFTLGWGAFETCKVVGGAVFAQTRHLRRLRAGCDQLGVTCPDDDRLGEAIRAVLSDQPGLDLGRLRITVTAGVASDRFGLADSSLLVTLTPMVPWPDDVAVLTAPWPRNAHSPLAGVKATSYLENVMIARWAADQGAQEALLATTTGMLCEGTASNVVVVYEDRLVTPPLSSGCLPGITRELLLEWAGHEGLPLVTEDLPMAEVCGAPSVLLTSSTRDVQPIRQLDGRDLSVNALAHQAVDVFRRHAAHLIDP